MEKDKAMGRRPRRRRQHHHHSEAPPSLAPLPSCHAVPNLASMEIMKERPTLDLAHAFTSAEKLADIAPKDMEAAVVQRKKYATGLRILHLCNILEFECV